MNTMIDAIGSAFRSERLTYRAIEDKEADKDFVFTHLSDPVTYALSNPSIHRPVNRKTSDEKTVAGITDSLLAVMICLTGDSPATSEPIGCLWITEAQYYQRRGFLGIRLSPAHQVSGEGLLSVDNFWYYLGHQPIPLFRTPSLLSYPSTLHKEIQKC
jgi:hypothetical protein